MTGGTMPCNTFHLRNAWGLWHWMPFWVNSGTKGRKWDQGWVTEVISPVLSKVMALELSPWLFAAMHQSTFVDLEKWVDERAWIVLRLPSGEMGREGAKLTAGVVYNVFDAAYRKVTIHKPVPYYFVIDEAQEIGVGMRLESMLSEGAKFGARTFVLAQSLSMMRRVEGFEPVVQALLANTSTQAFFSPDPEDADIIRDTLNATARFGITTLDLPTLTCWLRARLNYAWQPPTLLKVKPLKRPEPARVQALIREVIGAHPEDYVSGDGWQEQSVDMLKSMIANPIYQSYLERVVPWAAEGQPTHGTPGPGGDGKSAGNCPEKLHPRMIGDWAFRRSVETCGRNFYKRRHYEEFHMKKMRQKNLKAFFTNKILIAACVISPLVFFGVAAVLADVWSGPANRTTAGTCDVYHYHQGTFVCRETCGQPEYHICDAACASAGGCDSSRTVNNPGSSLPDATVSGSTSCSSAGNNGWCKGMGTLSPERERACQRLQHHRLRQRSVWVFMLADRPAIWNFPQGVTTNLGYWANSSFGDQSDEAYASMSVDSVAPTLTLTIPSPNGSNGWNKSGPVTASASATDATFGRGQRGHQRRRCFLHRLHGRSV